MQNLVETGLKMIGIVAPLGAYHMYITEEHWRLRQHIKKLQEEQKLQNKTTQEILKNIRKQNWW